MAEPSSIPKFDVRSLPGPDSIRRSRLKNGIVVLARENFSSPSVVIMGFLQAGSLLETRKNAGLADLTVSSLMRGTEARSFQQIYASIEAIGATLSLGAGKHSTSFQGKALAEDLGVLLKLLSEVLTTPTFPAKEVERLKAELLTSLAIRDQDSGAMASLTFSELAYPNHPYSLPNDGYRETVSAFSRSDLRKFHRERFGPEGMVIAVVGAVKASRAIASVRKALGAWENPKQVEPATVKPVEPPSEERRKRVTLPGKSQCDLVMGAPGPSRFDPSYLVAALGNSILGRFGMMGRIGEAVRESAGLAYYAYSSLSGGPGQGPWRVSAGVNPANLDRAIGLIRQEIRRFTSEEVTEQELADNKANFIGRLPLQLESNEGVAGALVHMERYALGLDFYHRYPGLIADITGEQILAEAQRHLHPDRLAIAVAGPETHGA